MFNGRKHRKMVRTLDGLVQSGHGELCFLVSQFLVSPDSLDMQTLHGLMEE